MKKVLLWFRGDDSPFLVRAITILLKTEMCDIVGIIGGRDMQGEFMINGRKIPFCSLSAMDCLEIDYVLVGETNIAYAEVMTILQQYGFIDEQVIADRTVCVPGFSFARYRQLKKSQPSIISLNCSGGIMSHLFTLPFRSPFVNMFMDEEDFLLMIERDLRTQLAGKLELVGSGYDEVLQINYPIYALNGLLLKMNHYPDYAFAREKWYERLQRINWYNLVFMMYTDSREILARFDALPLAKKICFVPFESDLPAAYCFEPEKIKRDCSAWEAANIIAGGHVALYDLWDMLLYGKKTELGIVANNCAE